jgi:hypothetical protein
VGHVFRLIGIRPIAIGVRLDRVLLSTTIECVLSGARVIVASGGRDLALRVWDLNEPNQAAWHLGAPSSVARLRMHCCAVLSSSSSLTRRCRRSLVRLAATRCQSSFAYCRWRRRHGSHRSSLGPRFTAHSASHVFWPQRCRHRSDVASQCRHVPLDLFEGWHVELSRRSSVS